MTKNVLKENLQKDIQIYKKIKQTKCPYGMTVGVRYLGKFAMPQTAQLFRHKKVPPKIDSANFSDSKYLQCS